jgi:hypothetical protein
MSEYLYIFNDSGNPARCTQAQYDEIIQTKPGTRIVSEQEWTDKVEGLNKIALDLYGPEPVEEAPAPIEESTQEVVEEPKAPETQTEEPKPTDEVVAPTEPVKETVDEVLPPIEEPKVKKTKKEITEEHQKTEGFPQLDDLMTLTNQELIDMLIEIDPTTDLTVESLKADLVETIVILREDAKTNPE